jgi:hypothetical protein
MDTKAVSKPPFLTSLGPALVILLVGLLVVAIAVWRLGGDPLGLARIGTRFSERDPNGTEGYDGQFIYYIAADPDPQRVALHLDVPAYRYQRILLPLLARALALGNQNAIPWTLALLGVLSLAGGTWAVSELLHTWGVSRWYAPVYGLWSGFLLALVVDLPEPLAYGLAAGALLAETRGRKPLAWMLLGLALFAKEVTMLFLVALMLVYLNERRWKDAAGLALIGLFPFVLFQAWLWATFGEPGIGSGGAMSTPFEIIPFMGLLRIGGYSLVYLLAMLAVFGPAVIFPALWGAWRATRQWLGGERNIIVAGLFFNALVIAFTPFSTFRETGGMLRFASGLVLALLLFAGRYRITRALNYSIFWIVLNVFLLK